MADASFLLQLGDFVFSTNAAAYSSISNSTAWTWAKHDRIGTAPVYQFTGPDSDTKSFAGVVYPHYAGGAGQIDKLRAEADKGTPLRLTNIEGKNLGLWVITSITEEQSAFVAGTKPRKQAYNLSITRYE